MESLLTGHLAVRTNPRRPIETGRHSMHLLQGPIAALLILGLLGPTTQAVAQVPSAPSNQPDQAKSRPRTRPVYQSAQLQGDDRILHALNRFTFGLRPG